MPGPPPAGKVCAKICSRGANRDDLVRNRGDGFPHGEEGDGEKGHDPIAFPVAVILSILSVDSVDDLLLFLRKSVLISH